MAHSTQVNLEANITSLLRKFYVGSIIDIYLFYIELQYKCSGSVNEKNTHSLLVLLHPRYLLYDVNPPEGFNLRRDVYIRIASLVKSLRKNGDDWVLVLSPWGRLYHWQSPDLHQVRIPWGEFFSLTSLQANVPVIEYEEFIAGELFYSN